MRKESQNPVGNVTLIQFQNNVKNVQPVVPFDLKPNLSFVTRFITPVVDQPSFAPPSVCASTSGCPSRFGIGDLTAQFYFAPKTKPNAVAGQQTGPEGQVSKNIRL